MGTGMDDKSGCATCAAHANPLLGAVGLFLVVSYVGLAMYALWHLMMGC